jgi:NAD(P)-dependent dehydrogenase (short-subunit alcohol dehydrogenase family)
MTAKYDLKDKVAIVTGSAGGIGKAIAEKFYQNGANVIISDVQIEQGQETARSLGKRAVFIPCDISDASQVNSLINMTVQQFGQLDIMVNNAGINSARPEDRVTVDKYPDATWHKMINVDLNGTFYCCKAAAGVMVKQKFGSIINISSIAGVVALRLQIGFVAAKAAIIKMTEAMACELAPMGVRVNTVSPGSTLTDATRKLFYGKDGSFSEMASRVVSFIPQGRPGEADEIAGAVLFLASDSASYINGHNIVVDGGWTCGFNRDF